MSNPVGDLLNNCLFHVQARIAQPCLLCGVRVQGQMLCGPCVADLPLVSDHRCPQCALPTGGGELCGACLKRPPAFDTTHCVYRYDFPADVLIQRLKYGGELPIARYLATRLAEAAASAARPDLLIPMPLHPARLRERGFNQAALIGRHLAGRLHIPLALDDARRLRDTPPQVGLPLRERRRNIRAAFACVADLRGRRVALVDDVMTSGASLDELARTVKQAGAIEVQAWVVARTVSAQR